VAAAQGLRADVSCGYFMGQTNSSFDLSSQTLAGVAALGADLSFDIYAEHVEMELHTWVGPTS
jgi:hypothetical protein